MKKIYLNTRRRYTGTDEMYKLLFLVTLGLAPLLLYSANTVQAQTSSDFQEAYDASSNIR